MRDVKFKYLRLASLGEGAELVSVTIVGIYVRGLY